MLNASRRIYDVTVDPRNSDLVYATGFEASAWRSADRGKTWSRIGGFNFKDGHRVIPDPTDINKIYITTFGNSVWHGPAAGDPKAVGRYRRTAIDDVSDLETAIRQMTRLVPGAATRGAICATLEPVSEEANSGRITKNRPWMLLLAPPFYS